MKVKDIVSVKPISTVIDFQSKDKSLIDSYIILEETGEYFLSILEGFTKQRDARTTEAMQRSIIPGRVNRCHKISGTYGMGKSYFLLMLRTLLESLDDKELYDEMVEKFSNLPSIIYQLDILESHGKHYIIVDINGKDFIQLDFKSTIEREVHKKLSERIGRENLNFNTFYEKSANQLIQWRDNNSPMYELFKDSFEKEIDFTYEEMINGLKQREKAAKEGFEQVYMQIMNEETKDQFNTLGEFLDEADRIAKENSYAGIVIIFDEFSSYLRGRAETGFLNIDLASIDILTEKTLVQNAKQIHFITSEHEDIEQILEESLPNLDTVKRTAGRFKDYQLYFDRGSKLVENVMEKDQGKLKKLRFDNQNIFSEYNQNNKSYKLEEIYPLNPFTLEYLIKISEKYAQGDRTLFTFMDEEFRSFVERDYVYDGDKLNLLGVDAIMNSFEKVILDEREEFARAYSTQMRRTNNSLEKRLVKALALDYAISITDVGRIEIGINNSNLKYILSLTDKELEDVKEYLRKETNDSQSYIIFNTGANGYELSPDTAGINIEEEIRKELSNTNEKRLLQNLLLNRSNALDIRTDYTLVKAARRFPFDRNIKGIFINSLGELQDINIEEEIASIDGSGKILFFIPPAGQNYDFSQVLEAAKTKSQEFIGHSLVIAIPKKSTFASEDVKILKRYEAMERLTKNEKIMDSPKAQNQVRLEIVNLRNEIYSKLGAFGRSENFVFLFKDEIIEDVKSIEDILALWMVEKLYPKFPIVNVQDFTTRNSSTQLIENLIIPRKAEAVDINSSKVFSKQIRETLDPLDLVKLTKTTQDYRVEIKYPKEPQVLEIFDIFKTPEEELSLKAKYNKLVSPPYGLNDPLLETLFATFLMVTDGYYLLDNNAARVEISSDNIKNIWGNCKLAKTKDAVSYMVKLDLINILETIDKNYVNSFSYNKLKATAPSDDFGQPENTRIIINYIKSFSKEVELFVKNLAFLPENLIFANKIDDLYRELERLSKLLRPEDMINDISQLIDKFFDNGIHIDDSKNKIDFNRYAKLQNFIDNTLWLKDNIDDLDNYTKDINRLKDNIEDTYIDAIHSRIELSEKQLKEALNYISSGDNWKNKKYKEEILIEELKKHIDEAIELYNKEYKFNHDMLKMTRQELFDAVIDFEYNPFIEALEKINFDDLDKLPEIKGEINNIKRCNEKLKISEDTIVVCGNCGNLSKVYLSTVEMENKRRDTTKKLGRLVDQYRGKVWDLNSIEEVKKQYNRDETIVEFAKSKNPEYVDVVRELISIANDDWWGNVERVKFLIEKLYPIINEFIEVSKLVEFKEIKFSDVIKQLSKNIQLSGFKNMNFDQFQDEILNEVNKIREDYDIINIIE